MLTTRPSEHPHKQKYESCFAIFFSVLSTPDFPSNYVLLKLYNGLVISSSAPRVELEPFHPHFLARQNAPAAILSSIESVYVLSNPFTSKPSIVL